MNEKLLIDIVERADEKCELAMVPADTLIKFAELIVAECITIANNVHMCRDGRPVAEDIKKRFGVEE
jgi:hypothetical protein